MAAVAPPKADDEGGEGEQRPPSTPAAATAKEPLPGSVVAVAGRGGKAGRAVRGRGAKLFVVCLRW